MPAPPHAKAPQDAEAPQQQARRRWPAWLGLALLLLLFEIPAIIRPKGLNPTLLRPTADLVVLLLLHNWSRHRPNARAYKAVWISWLVMLCVFRVDSMIFFLLMRQEPLLYDQLYMLRHAWVLISDLWSPMMFAALLGFGLALVALVFGTRRALRSFYMWGDSGRGSTWVRKGSIFVALCAVLGGAQHLIWGSSPKNPRHRFVRWEGPALLLNVRRSLGIYRAIKRGLKTSPYRAYNDIDLTRKPDVRLYLIESYGAVLATHPELAPWWQARMEGLEQDLQAQGWHFVSAYVRAPVSGGRSWLAEASILTGIRVRYEAEFHQVLDHIDEAPNFVSFLAAQGYNTVSLSPADRERAGIKEVNYYDYVQRITFDDLDYRGKRWGWGIVPDEFSLGKADDELIKHDGRPLFLNAHLVTSHAPWRRVPTSLGNWREWTRPGNEALEVDVDEDARRGVLRSMRRFERKDETRFMYAGKASDLKVTRFRVAINYELDVLHERLGSMQGDALVIVMGDHQPPLVTPETADFAVPIHVFARDPALLAELEKSGFTPGLRLEPDAEAIATHQGLFSILVRNLAACCSDAESLPGLRPQGLEFSTARD